MPDFVRGAHSVGRGVVRGLFTKAVATMRSRMEVLKRKRWVFIEACCRRRREIKKSKLADVSHLVLSV